MTGSIPESRCRLLAGRRAVVTGSTSGIGRAIALHLAAAGADLVVHGGSRHERAEAVAREIRLLGQQADVVMADLSAQQQRETFVDQVWGRTEKVDIWINNAGADVLTGPPADWDFRRKLEHLWQTDVLGTIELSRAAGKRMWESGSGDCSIVNVGWDQVEQGMGGDSGEMFAAVKGAIMAFTRSLARSLAPRVRVNCVAPGWIRTAWGEDAAEYWQQRACRESLLQRWGTPHDVAEVARFLVSPAAAFVTGQIVMVNGGFRAGYAAEP